MNTVHLSGTIANSPMLVGVQGNLLHAVFQLCVSHKTSKGEWRKELYTVNSWYTSAQWVIQNLKQGQRVALQGYLTQRVVRTNEGIFTAVEVTSQEFLPMEARSSYKIESLIPKPGTEKLHNAGENQEDAMAS